MCGPSCHVMEPAKSITTSMGCPRAAGESSLCRHLQCFSADPWLRSRAATTVRSLLVDLEIRVIPQSRTSFLTGLELYALRPDKGYSLVDCISMQTMRKEGLTEVLTNDRHFEQEGFKALFRDS